MKTLEKLLDLVGTCEVIDMTHPLEEEIPHWPTQPGVKFHTGMNYVEDGSYWRGVTLCEHSGTHIDALSHFFKDSENVDEIPLKRLIGRGVKYRCDSYTCKRCNDVEDVKGSRTNTESLKKEISYVSALDGTKSGKPGKREKHLWRTGPEFQRRQRNICFRKK